MNRVSSSQTAGKVSFSRKTGFTLIELLVVIAIIALLAAILFPVFARARENGRKATCINNLKQLGVGFMQYTQDFDEILPNGGGYSATADSGQWMVTPTPVGTACSSTAPCRPDLGVVYPYIKNQQVYLCPSDSNRARRLSYSMNSQCTSGSAPGYQGRALADATKTSATILLLDEGLTINDGYFSSASTYDTPSLMHLDGANNLFLDGHTKWKSKPQYQPSDFTY